MLRVLMLSRRSIGLVGQLCRQLSMTSPSASKHLRISKPLDDTFYNMTSKLMRGLEHDNCPICGFDWLGRQIGTGTDKSKQRTTDENDLVVIDKDGNRKFQLVLALADFKPEDIKVRTEGNSLCVSAKKESKSPDQYYLREFTQTYILPEELKIQELKSKWMDDGYLIIDAPLPKQIESQPKVKEIQIEHAKK